MAKMIGLNLFLCSIILITITLTNQSFSSSPFFVSSSGSFSSFCQLLLGFLSTHVDRVNGAVVSPFFQVLGSPGDVK